MNVFFFFLFFLSVFQTLQKKNKKLQDAFQVAPVEAKQPLDQSATAAVSVLPDARGVKSNKINK